MRNVYNCIALLLILLRCCVRDVIAIIVIVCTHDFIAFIVLLCVLWFRCVHVREVITDWHTKERELRW